jgi:hypothetical protein
MNLKIGVQGAMLVSTNETIIAGTLGMTPTKRAKKARAKEEGYHS